MSVCLSVCLPALRHCDHALEEDNLMRLNPAKRGTEQELEEQEGKQEEQRGRREERTGRRGGSESD